MCVTTDPGLRLTRLTARSVVPIAVLVTSGASTLPKFTSGSRWLSVLTLFVPSEMVTVWSTPPVTAGAIPTTRPL